MLAHLPDHPTSLHILVDLLGENHPSKADELKLCGDRFLKAFHITGDDEDICQAIKGYKEAAACLAEDDPRLGGFLSDIASGHEARYEKFGLLGDLQEVNTTMQKVVAMTPDGHADLPRRLNNLGISFSSRFEQTGEMQDISEAIQHQQRAVQLTPDDHADLPALLNNLGKSFLCRFERTGEMQDISEAIRHQHRAVQLTPDGHADLPGQLNNLGMLFCCHFEQTGDMQDISEAIRHQQHAVQLSPDGDADLPVWLKNLGISFLSRFEQTGEMQDVSEAIQYQQRVVQLTPDGHADLPRRLNNLGSSFSRRFEQMGEMQDVSEAIQYQQRAVQLTPDGHADLPGWLNNLGTSFSRRFEQTGDMQDISEAIRHQQCAVQLIPDGNAALPAPLNNLGSSFSCQFEQTGDMQDISEAIQHQQRAVQLTPDGHADLPGRLNNLGISFLRRFKLTKVYEDLQFAVSNFRLSATSSGPPSHRLNAAKQWATLSHSPSSPSELLDAHSCIIHLLSLISGLEHTVQHRYEILVDASHLSLAASAAALSLDHPASDKALEWLVEGRCIVWNQVNQLCTPVAELCTHHPALAERFASLSRELENAGLRTDSRHNQMELSIDDKISLEDEARMHLKHARDWEELLKTIKNIPQFKDFLQPRKCADIMSSLPEEGPIVIINIHSDRCDALALVAGAEKPLHIPLPNFSYQEAARLANGLCDYLFSLGIRSPRAMQRLGHPLPSGSGSDSGIDLPVILKALWSNIVSPILEALAFSVCFPSFFDHN